MTADIELAVVDAALARFGGNPLDARARVEAQTKLIAAVASLQAARKEQHPKTLWGLPVVIVPEGTIPADPGFVLADLPRMIKSDDLIEGVYALMEGRIQMVMTENDTEIKYRVKIELEPITEKDV